MQLLAPDSTSALATARHALPFHDAADRAAFFGYPADEQERIRALHDAMLRIAAAKTVRAGCRAAARPRAGWSVARLNTLYVQWRANGRHWSALLDTRRFPEDREPELPEAMQAHIRAEFSANQRKNKPAWRKIIRQWERWLHTGDARHALPGYAACPPPSRRCPRHPEGLSYKNACRYAPPPAELTLARIGVAAATALLPWIHGTRDGARFLEYVSGDDVWLNRKCMMPGFGPCRIIQFGLMDYAASYYLPTFIQRPITPRADGTDEQLKRRDFLWTLALMLERYGYPLDWQMHLIVERGTATLTAAEARWLWEVSEGQIVVGWSTMEGELVHAWEERKTGNSNAKPWHESFHNLLQNEEGDIAGQVGKDRDHQPASLMGRERHALGLDNAAAQLTPQLRAEIRMPFPSAQHAYAQTLDRVTLCNARQQHDCEGFETVMDWRPRGLRIPPRPEGELPEWLAANPRSTVDDVEFFPRPESPVERMQRLSAQGRFQMLPASVWRRFYEDCHEVKRIDERGGFEFSRTVAGQKKLYRFEPATTDDILPVGQEVCGFYRPMDHSAIHLFSGDGRYLLTWPRVVAHRRDDAAGKQLDFARKRSFLNHALGNVRQATEAEVAQARADDAHNGQRFAEAGLIPALGALQRGGNATADAVQRVSPDAPTPAPAAPRRRASASAFMPPAPAAPAEKPATFAAEPNPNQPTRRAPAKASAFLP